jgi:hypothetical protein
MLYCRHAAHGSTLHILSDQHAQARLPLLPPQVFAHAVDDLQVSPSFQAATPSCIQGPRGELLAVRCDADALSLADRARAAGEETGSNPLLLLDLVDLQVGGLLRAGHRCAAHLNRAQSLWL